MKLKEECFPFSLLYYRQISQNKNSTATPFKIQLCPVYCNIFDDLSPTIEECEQALIVKKRLASTVNYRKKQRKFYKNLDATLDISQTKVKERDEKLKKIPVIDFPPKNAFCQYNPTFTIEKIKKRLTLTGCPIVQTKYRESEAQTDPWQPPYIVRGEGTPEILTLDYLKWGENLPAGHDEFELIERARMRNTWMNMIKPNIDDEESLSTFRNYVEILEKEEWVYREERISKINKLRLELFEDVIDEVMQNWNTRTESRLQFAKEQAQVMKQKKILKIQQETNRKLRKLSFKMKRDDEGDIDCKPSKIIKEHLEKSSEIYAPLIRHGVDPKRSHKSITNSNDYEVKLIGIENYDTLPNEINKEPKVYDKISNNVDLCPKLTKWSWKVLEEIQDTFQRYNCRPTRPSMSLRRRKRPEIIPPSTPEIEDETMESREFNLAVTFIQQMIKGRATQSVMYEGRDTCRELIQELKFSGGLLKEQKFNRIRQWIKVKKQQREEAVQRRMVGKLEDTLGKLQGTVVGSLLDFLNKEMRRLIEERKAHAVCLLNERERFMREAIEGGRRQREIRRRKEHDEMFKQMVKVTQDSVDLYLEQMITEGIEFASEEQAKEYIEKLASKVQTESERNYEKMLRMNITEQDEMINDMVFNMLLPETEKSLIRDKLSKRQLEKLRTVHDTLFNEFSELKVPVEGGPSASIEHVEDEEGLKEDLEAYIRYLEEGSRVKVKSVTTVVDVVEEESPIFYLQSREQIYKYMSTLITSYINEALFGKESSISMNEKELILSTILPLIDSLASNLKLLLDLPGEESNLTKVEIKDMVFKALGNVLNTIAKKEMKNFVEKMFLTATHSLLQHKRIREKDIESVIYKTLEKTCQTTEGQNEVRKWAEEKLFEMLNEVLDQKEADVKDSEKLLKVTDYCTKKEDERESDEYKEEKAEEDEESLSSSEEERLAQIKDEEFNKMLIEESPVEKILKITDYSLYYDKDDDQIKNIDEEDEKLLSVVDYATKANDVKK